MNIRPGFLVELDRGHDVGDAVDVERVERLYRDRPSVERGASRHLLTGEVVGLAVAAQDLGVVEVVPAVPAALDPQLELRHAVPEELGDGIGRGQGERWASVGRGGHAGVAAFHARAAPGDERRDTSGSMSDLGEHLDGVLAEAGRARSSFTSRSPNAQNAPGCSTSP